MQLFFPVKENTCDREMTSIIKILAKYVNSKLCYYSFLCAACEAQISNTE